MVLIEYLDVGTILCGLITFCVIRAVIKSRKNNYYKLPPGPVKLPVIGTLYAHGICPERLRKTGEKYGDMFSIYIGSKLAIIIQGYGIFQQASKRVELSDRSMSKGHVAKLLNPNAKGIMISPWKQAKNTRPCALAILRELGVGRSVMEEKVLEVIDHLLTSLDRTNQKAFDPSLTLEYAVAKVILYTTVNKIHDENDPKFLDFMNGLKSSLKAGLPILIVTQLPFLRHIPPFSTIYTQYTNGFLQMTKTVSEWVDEHITNFLSGQNDDFVERYLAKDVHLADGNLEHFDCEQLVYLVRDLLIGGSETSTTSLRWTLLCLANRQELQEKLRNEIHDSIGKDKPIKMIDKSQLPLMEAFLDEIQRYYTVVPLALPHEATVDVELSGFDIPKSTMIFFNLHAIHRDKRLWKDPNCFRPERFLDEEGKYQRDPHLVQFGSGKRSCLGEILARQELFLFTSNIVRSFKILPPEGVKLSENGVMSFVYRPDAFEIRTIPL